MTKITNDEKIRAYKEFIIKYLSKANWHDYESIAKRQDTPTIKKLSVALDFIRENMTEDVYNDFYKKAFPLEYEGSEELKEELIQLATDVNYSRAGLIDILDKVGNIHKYAYMVKHLRFKYGLISAGVFQANAHYVDSVSLYDKEGINLTSSYQNLTKEEEAKVRQIVKDRGLMLNNMTYAAAYIYAKNHGMVKVNPNKR